MVDIIEKIEGLENLIITTQKQVLNIDELSGFIGLSKSTIYKLTMNGKIPHYKQAKHLYFDKDEVNDWLRENRGYNQDQLKQDLKISLLNMKGGVK